MKLGYLVWVEIVCIRCSETGPGAFSYGGIPRKAMAEEAENLGWMLVQDEDGDLGWFCPNCKKGTTH